MMKDALRLLISAKMIRWLLCPHQVWFWFKAHSGVRRIFLLLVPLFPSEQPCGFTLFWWIRREGCYSWSCLVLTEHFPFLSHTQTVALQICFVFSHLVPELVGNLRSLGLFMHTPTPWVFTFMSFITPPPAFEFKMKHLKFDQGRVLMSAWIICVPCFLQWFLPFCLPSGKKSRLTAFYRLLSLHTPVFSLFIHEVPCKPQPSTVAQELIKQLVAWSTFIYKSCVCTYESSLNNYLHSGQTSHSAGEKTLLLAIIYKYFKYQGWFVNADFVGSTCVDITCAILIFPSGAEDGPCPIINLCKEINFQACFCCISLHFICTNKVI